MLLSYIDSFAFILAPIFYKVLYMSIIASIVSIVIVVLRSILKRFISPKWISRIWITFFIVLVIPFSIKTKMSIYNYLPDSIITLNNQIDEFSNVSYRELYDDVKIENYQNNNENAKEKINSAFYKSLIFDVIIPYVWICLVVFFITLYIITYFIFSFKNKHSKYSSERLNLILEKCKKKLNINRNITIIFQEYINEPSIFGVFNVRILLNKSIEDLSDKQIEYIIIHELSHYKRKDNILIILISILKYVYFFNPIIFLMLKQWIKDIELSTDEIALKEYDNEEKKEYLKLLVKLTDGRRYRFMSKSLCMSDDKRNLKTRIEMVKQFDRFKQEKVYVSIISITIIVLILLVFGTSKITSYTEITNLEEIIQKGAINLNEDKKVDELLKYLPFSKYYGECENLYATQSYELKIYYNSNFNNKNLDYNNLILFCIINNLDKITYNFNDQIVSYNKMDVIDSNVNIFNENGVVCFKNSSIAYDKFKKEYKDALKFIQKEFNLPFFSKWTYEEYKTYGWQANTNDNELKEKCNEVSQFLDIYENGYFTYRIIDKYPLIDIETKVNNTNISSQDMKIIANRILSSYFYSFSTDDIKAEQKINKFISLSNEFIAGDQNEFIVGVYCELDTDSKSSIFGQVNSLGKIKTYIMVRIKKDENNANIYYLKDIGEYISTDGLE